MSYYERRGGDRGSGRIQGSGGRGGHVLRGRSGLAPRGLLGVNSRPSARTIAKARPNLSLCFCSWSGS
jgi:THO complex subunit 4